MKHLILCVLALTSFLCPAVLAQEPPVTEPPVTEPPVVQHPPFVTSWKDKHGVTYTVTTEIVQGNPTPAMLATIEAHHNKKVAKLQVLHPPV